MLAEVPESCRLVRGSTEAPMEWTCECSLITAGIPPLSGSAYACTLQEWTVRSIRVVPQEISLLSLRDKGVFVFCTKRKDETLCHRWHR